MKQKFLSTLALAALTLLPQRAWGYDSQEVYNMNGSTTPEWTKLSGTKGLFKSSETQWDNTSGYTYTLSNGSAYYALDDIMPTLTYSASYSVEFFVNAKYGVPFQYAIYKKGVTPTSSMLGASDAVFSLTCTTATGKTEDVGTDMTVSINRPETTVTLKSKTYYKVVVNVNPTNTSYTIYPLSTASTPYTVDTENSVASGTVSSAEIGGLYMKAGTAGSGNSVTYQTMRTDDILVSFMPNARTVKTITATNSTTTNGLNLSSSKYYERYSISAIDYDDATIDNSNLTIAQNSDTYSDLSSNIVSFKGIGTTTVTVNNKSTDIENTTAYLKAATYDFTSLDNLAADNDHTIFQSSSTNASLTGFGTDDITRYYWIKSSNNSKAAKWIANGVKAANDYHQFYPGYGINVTYGSNIVMKTYVSDSYLCLAGKKNISTEASGDGSTVYNATATTYTWAKSDRVALESRDDTGSDPKTYNGVVYTGLDVYIPDGTTVTPTLDGTYNITTFSYPYALDFSGLTTMTAWRATTATNSAITLAQVTDVVPAGTPLVLRGTAEAIPVANEPGTTITNLLKPVLDNDINKTVAAGTGGTTNYVLTVQEKNVVFAPISETSASVAYGKAYLNAPTPAEARPLIIDFSEGDVTGISEDVRLNSHEVKNNAYFNLAGQRISQPTRGLYIVKGKKVVIK